MLCIGGGPVGLSIAQVAMARGARKVLVAETSPAARRILAQFDLTAIDPRSIREELSAHLGLPEVGVICDSVGIMETFTEAIPLLGASGVYVNLAVHAASLSFNATLLGSEKTITTTSSNAYYDDVREAYDLIFARQVHARPYDFALSAADRVQAGVRSAAQQSQAGL